MPLMANRVIDSPAVSPVHYDVRRNVGGFHGVSLHILQGVSDNNSLMNV